MSLLKWKELARKKSELGKRVHNAITQSDIDEQTTRESFIKVFQQIITKLDDVVASNLKIPQMKRKTKKKEEGVPTYGVDIEDEVEDMNLDDSFDRPVLPENANQIVPKPPTYDESLKDVLEGKKEIYVDRQYLSQKPPEYDYNESPNNEEDAANRTLDHMGVVNYENVEKRFNQPDRSQKQQ